MENGNGYVVISMNDEKVGYYVFTHFENVCKPCFNPNHCITDKIKVYKRKSSAVKVMERINFYYQNNPHIKSMVLSVNELMGNAEYEQMEKLFNEQQ